MTLRGALCVVLLALSTAVGCLAGEGPARCAGYCDFMMSCRPDLGGLKYDISDRFCESDCSDLYDENPEVISELFECSESVDTCEDLRDCEAEAGSQL